MVIGNYEQLNVAQRSSAHFGCVIYKRTTAAVQQVEGVEIYGRWGVASMCVCGSGFAYAYWVGLSFQVRFVYTKYESARAFLCVYLLGGDAGHRDKESDTHKNTHALRIFATSALPVYSRRAVFSTWRVNKLDVECKRSQGVTAARALADRFNLCGFVFGVKSVCVLCVCLVAFFFLAFGHAIGACARFVGCFKSSMLL